jgi:diadenosine tetraphosphatase ApaH/serine/threonine PP2A family protein phosphatase
MTFQKLSAASLQWIAGLPVHRQVGDARLVHGFPPDSATLYLFQMSTAQKAAAMQELPERVCFVGHTHVLGLIGLDGHVLADVGLAAGLNRLDPALRYLANIGSVGQPRDGDRRAAYALWEPQAHTLEIRRVAYDTEAAAAKIVAAGMPAAHARRLLG